MTHKNLLPGKTRLLMALAIADVILTLADVLPPIGLVLSLAILIVELAKIAFLATMIRRSPADSLFATIVVTEGSTFLIDVTLSLTLIPHNGLMTPIVVGLNFILGRLFSGLAIGDCFSEKN